MLLEERQDEAQVSPTLEHDLCDLPVSIAHLSAATVFTCVSRDFAAWLGQEREDMVGRRAKLFFTPDVWDPLLRHFEIALSGQEMVFHHPMVTPRGRRWTEFTLRPHRNRDEYLIGVYLLAHDIHEHHQARLLLEGSQKQFQLLTNSIPAPICSFDVNRRYTYANQSCLEVLGRTFDQIEGRLLSEILAPEDYCLIEPYIVRALSGEPVSYERPITFPDGSKRWMYISYVAIRNDAGEIIGAWAVFSNIDQLRHVENDLRQAYRILNTHVENTPLAVIEWDGNMRMQRWSPQAEQLFDWEPQQVIGKQPEEFGFVFEADRGIVSTAIANLTNRVEARNTCIARHYKRDGTVIYCECHSSAVFDESGQLLSILTMLQDLSERMQAEANLKHLATHDPLTGLFNRAAFGDHLERALARARRENNRVYLLFIDLDRFKFVNDTLGHHMGDELLRQVVSRLRSALREIDTLCRLGGDEFTAIIERVPDVDCITVMAKRLLEALSKPFNLGAHTATISASIGISAFPDNGKDADELIKNADTAMFRAKERGRNGYEFFTNQAERAGRDRARLDDDMRRAFANRQFYLAYQPKVSLLTGRITGVEALLRWRHPTLGDLTPDRFIGVAEESGLIVPLGEWAIETACRQLQRWHDVGLPPVSMAVNVSARQFSQQRFITSIEEAMANIRVPDRRGDLEIEITETCLMSYESDVIARLEELKQKKVKIAVDDFGTGYSSLSYLARLPVDTLKIDRSFINNLDDCANAAAVVVAVIHLAHSLGLKVIAEGVETAEQLSFLTRHGCDDCQGFLLSRPVTPGQIAGMLYQQQYQGRLLPRNQAAASSA